MAPTLSAQLCLGLCLFWGIWAQEGSLPRPTLRAEPSFVIPVGKSVTLCCKGPPGAELYYLWKEGGYLNMEKSADGREAKVLISNMTRNTAGRYHCDYKKQSWWSEASDPLELIVSGLFESPSLSALPSSQVASGQKVTLQCQSQLKYVKSTLYKDGKQITYQVTQYNGQVSQTNFLILAMSPAHGGTYQCYSFYSNFPYVWSASSDSLMLRVTDAAPLDYTVINVVRLVLAGLVLIILGILLIEAWKTPGGAEKSPKCPYPKHLGHDQPQEERMNEYIDEFPTA